MLQSFPSALIPGLVACSGKKKKTRIFINNSMKSLVLDIWKLLLKSMGADILNNGCLTFN